MAGTRAVLARSTPAVAVIYERLLERLAEVGPFEVDEKETSVHLVRRTGFASVHPRRAHLALTVRLDRPFVSPRAKTEQVARTRWQHEFRIEAPEGIDDEVVALLRDAYEVAG